MWPLYTIVVRVVFMDSASSSYSDRQFTKSLRFLRLMILRLAAV